MAVLCITFIRGKEKYKNVAQHQFSSMARLGQVRKVLWCNKILVIFVLSVLEVATSASHNTL